MMLFFGLNLVVQELIKRVDGDGGDLRAPEKIRAKPTRLVSVNEKYTEGCQLNRIFTESAHWADSVYKSQLEGMARYAGLLLAPAEGFGQGFFFSLRAEKGLLC